MVSVGAIIDVHRLNSLCGDESNAITSGERTHTAACKYHSQRHAPVGFRRALVAAAVLAFFARRPGIETNRQAIDLRTKITKMITVSNGRRPSSSIMQACSA